MSIIEWNDSMATGYRLVDEQHKGLVKLINDIARAKDTDAGDVEISLLIRRFYDYTTTHFRDEEALMDHFTYKDYFRQVHEHLACSMQAIEFHRRFTIGEPFDMQAFLQYVVRWFLDHTLTLDQTLAQHLRQQGQQDHGRP